MIKWVLKINLIEFTTFYAQKAKQGTLNEMAFFFGDSIRKRAKNSQGNCIFQLFSDNCNNQNDHIFLILNCFMKKLIVFFIKFDMIKTI